jgi:23S rRNA (cytidine1920-2'-O)/16S rRNA (cytidine1409-2'-O)-methyltransferase
MANKKERLDVLLVERGLIDTREKAKRAVMAGTVYSGSERLDKPGVKIESTAPLEIKGNPIPYVSRGGLKLEKAIITFDVTVTDKIMIDIGASTGGFTDCALQNGAEKVYALDVGYNQLAWKLRQDKRVIVMERTNFRHVTPPDFQEGLPNFATIDVSFISLKLILPVLKKIVVPGSDIIALVKPQFEAGKEEVGKKGIIRDPKIHQKVLNNIIDFSLGNGYRILNISYSPITGGDGNIEFLLHIQSTDNEHGERMWDGTVENIVDQAHKELKSKG